MEVTGKDENKTASESVRVLRTRPSPLQEQTAANTPKRSGLSGSGDSGHTEWGRDAESGHGTAVNPAPTADTPAESETTNP